MKHADEASPVEGDVSLPYMVHTTRGYEVTGPDKDSEIEVEVSDGWGRFLPLYLSEADLLMMLKRIRRANVMDETRRP
jgi:hypothetical protein